MNLETAHRINSDMIHLYMVSNNLKDYQIETINRLKTLSLAKLLEAKNMVEEDDIRKMKEPGPHYLYFYPDERLIAAIYTWLWYPAQDEIGGIDPILHIGDQALILLKAPKNSDLDETD